MSRQRQCITALLTLSLCAAVFSTGAVSVSHAMPRKHCCLPGDEAAEDAQKAVDWLHEQCMPKHMNNTTEKRLKTLDRQDKNTNNDKQGRAGQGRAGQGGQGRAGQGRAGRAGQGRAGRGRAGQGRAGQGRAGKNKRACGQRNVH